MAGRSYEIGKASILHLGAGCVVRASALRKAGAGSGPAPAEARLTKLLFPSRLTADRLGITLVDVNFWLTRPSVLTLA